MALGQLRVARRIALLDDHPIQEFELRHKGCSEHNRVQFSNEISLELGIYAVLQ